MIIAYKNLNYSEENIVQYEFNTTKERSALMRKIHSTETKAEVALRKSLWHQGIRYRKNYKLLPGKPDIVITSHKIAIFIDGDFWHGYNWEEKKQRIKPNRSYWIPKIEKTIARDKENNEAITAMGWRVLRFWERDVKRNLGQCVDTISSLIYADNNHDL